MTFLRYLIIINFLIFCFVGLVPASLLFPVY